MTVPHAWNTTPAVNATVDTRAQFPPGMPASALDDAMRGLMASAAIARDDGLGVGLVTSGGTNNAFVLSTGQNLIDPASTAGGGAGRITHPFDLRVTFNAAPSGMAINAPTLAIDGAAPATLTKADGSALIDGDIGTAKSYGIRGYAFASGVLTKICLVDLTPSDIAAGAVPPAPATPTVSATLALSDDNRDQYATGTTVLTMPSNAPVGWRSGLNVNDNPTSGTLSVTAAIPSGDYLNGTLNGNVVLPPGGKTRLILVSRSGGVGLWRTDPGLSTNADTVSFGSAGYVKFANGLILQWAQTTAPGPTITLPIAFPNACLAVFLSGNQQNQPSITIVQSAFNLTKTSFQTEATIINGGNVAKESNSPFFYLALGY